MLENISYCPVLYTRVSEIKALGQLPAISKTRMFPLLVSRPWANAKYLSSTWEKIAEAFGGAPFALDLDPFRENSDSGRPASGEFNTLFSPQNGFSNYYQALQGIDFAVPVLRMSNGEATQLEQQIAHIGRLERGAVIRLPYGAAAPAIRAAELVCSELEDVIVFVDAGWSRDLLGREAWATGIVQALTALPNLPEIVISGSSFPDNFSGISGRGAVNVEERTFFANLSRRYNQIQLTYGDWGSTRPPYDPTPMKNIPRLDIPLLREWVFFRQVEDETYQNLAERAIRDRTWPRDLQIWGTYMIRTTAEALPGGIRSPASAAAVRINIHLHRQAQYDVPGNPSDSDEPYTDD